MSRAGAVIVSRNLPLRILVLYRAKKTDWSFPKGHTEEGETAEQAMHREVLEETGLKVEILGNLPDHNYRNSVGKHITCAYYLVRSLDDSTLRPETAADTTIWLPVDGLVSLLTAQALIMYWHSIVPQVRKMVGEIK